MYRLSVSDESYRYNLAHREYVNSRMLRFARDLLAAKIGVIEAARRLREFHGGLCTAAPEIGETLRSFVAIDSETDNLPIGEVRRHWNPRALASLDGEIAAAESLYRETALRAAARLFEQIENYRANESRPAD